MIQYSISKTRLEGLIEAEKAGWLARAAERTGKFASIGRYDSIIKFLNVTLKKMVGGHVNRYDSEPRLYSALHSDKSWQTAKIEFISTK